MSVSNDEKLKAVMTEYETLKNEAMEIVKLQMQLYPLGLGAISLVFGYVIVNGKHEALLLLPFITILLAYRWIWDVKLLEANRKYLLKIEKEIIPQMMSSTKEKKNRDSSVRLIGYQTHYENWRKTQSKWDWLISAILLFGVPTAIGIAYCFSHIFGFALPWLKDWTANLPSIFLLSLLAAIVYIPLSAWLIWIGIKTYRKR